MVGLGFIFWPLPWALSPGLTPHPCSVSSPAGLLPAQPTAHPAPRQVRKIARLESPL